MDIHIYILIIHFMMNDIDVKPKLPRNNFTIIIKGIFPAQDTET